MVVCGRGAQALRAQAQRLREHVAGCPESSAADVGLSLAARPLLERRAVVVGADARGAAGRGSAPCRRAARGGVRAARPERRLAFMFTGQGAQRVGMGRELYRDVPACSGRRSTRCAPGSDEHLGRSSREVVFGEGGVRRTRPR